jgi:hypothetical protein
MSRRRRVAVVSIKETLYLLLATPVKVTDIPAKSTMLVTEVSPVVLVAVATAPQGIFQGLVFMFTVDASPEEVLEVCLTKFIALL